MPGYSMDDLIDEINRLKSELSTAEAIIADLRQEVKTPDYTLKCLCDSRGQEIEELKARLAVYEEGRPCNSMLLAIANETGDSDNHEWLYAEKWLRRLAGVENGKSKKYKSLRRDRHDPR